MKKKIKKFGRGGDIVTGIGAALVGKALYDKYMKGDSKDDDYTRRVKEYGTKGKFPEEKSKEEAKPEEEAKPKREEYVAADAEENAAKKEALAGGMKYKNPEGPAAQDVSGKKPIIKNNNKPPKPPKSDSGGKSKPYPILSKPNEERPSKPYPVDLPSVRAAEHRKFLQTRAGIGGKGITTPGDPNAKASRQKGRSANPIQETIDYAGKSVARTPAQKMAENARLVEERRKKEKARKQFEEEAAQGRGIKKGGMVKKYAAGGTTTSKPEPKKAPMPDFARQAKENRERDQRVKKEREAYDKYDKTRLKDQGSFKKGGMTASKRADGIAIRGKTRA